jgi:hypothetical protein
LYTIASEITTNQSAGNLLKICRTNDGRLKCREATGESNFMIGREAIVDQYLFQRIKGSVVDFSWLEAKRLLPTIYDASLMFHSENFAITRPKY